MRVRLPSLMLLACLVTTAAFMPSPEATAAPAVALAPARQTITLGDVGVVTGGTHPGPREGCPLCAQLDTLKRAKAVDARAMTAAIRREQLAGNLPADLRDLNMAQRATLLRAMQSVRIDLSKLSPDQLTDLEVTVKRYADAKDRDDILASLRYYLEIAKGVSKPVVIKAEVKEKVVGLVNPDDDKWMSVTEAVEAYRKRKDAPAAWRALEPRWKVIAGQSRLFDVRDLDDAQFAELVSALQEMEPAIGGLSYRFDAGFAGSRDRLKELRGAARIDVRVDADSLAKVRRFGKIAIDILGGNWEAKDILSGRVVEFMLAHRDRDADIIDRLIEEAKAGKLKDKHIVLMFCADFTKPEVLKKLMELRAAVLKGKDGEDAAASLLMPSKDLHVPGMTLAALAVKNDPSLLDSGGTPSQVVQRVFLRTADMLEECKKADDPLKAINEVFKNEKAADFFKKGGDKVDIDAIDRAIERLRSDWIFFIQFVMEDGGVKKHVC